MKKFTTILLIGALTVVPWQRPRAQVGPVVLCVAIVVVVAAGAAVVYVSSCGSPKYYCVSDPEQGNYQWCTATSRKDAALEGLKIMSGPYKKVDDCNLVCTNFVKGPEVSALTANIFIEKSTNLVNWVECAAITAEPDCFEWADTNAMTSACFYRVRYQQ